VRVLIVDDEIERQAVSITEQNHTRVAAGQPLMQVVDLRMPQFQRRIAHIQSRAALPRKPPAGPHRTAAKWRAAAASFAIREPTLPPAGPTRATRA
jgi:hypothetical protein